jgi:glycosyltransferase involved in cell wall biosynthesis
MGRTGKSKIWITWDDHRRSRELAKELEFNYVVLESGANWLVRYIYLSLVTIITLLKYRPKIVVCQNPSVVLAAMLCLLKPILRLTVIVDRHSNFKTSTRKSQKFKWRIFHWLSDYSLRKADFTIVTNQQASDYVEEFGATSLIVPDKIPKLFPDELYCNDGNFSFFFICTFSDDEPVEAVLEGFSRFRNDYSATLYVSGNYEKFPLYTKYVGLKGIEFIGYVDDQEYINHLYSCSAVIVLTTMPMTLNCGSYEAVSASKPQIVSDSEEISSYFYKGSISVSPSRFSETGLYDAFRKMVNEYPRLKSEQIELKEEIDVSWHNRLEKLNEVLEN